MRRTHAGFHSRSVASHGTRRASVGGLLHSCRLLALFGHGGMSDLSPFCDQKRTSTKHLDDGARTRLFRIYVPSATAS